MKFSLTFFATIVAVSVLIFVASPINACEKECREGISNAFGDNYTIEIKKLMEVFISKLKDNVFFGLQDIKSSTKSECNKVIEDEVNKFQSKFSEGLEELIENSIFEQTPQFKGQCQHPLRVKQPPAGVAWTMDDCKNQDYICGNPPAICHFMDEYVKPRNVRNVNQKMSESLTANGSFLNLLYKSVIETALKSGVKGFYINDFKTVVKNNILNEFNIFSTFFTSEFCKGTTCDHYDDDIKKKLLSYP